MSTTKLFFFLGGVASVFAAAVPSLPFDSLSQFGIRDGTTCGGVAGLEQCGNGFPSDFCCPQGKSCIKLNTTTTANAAICCPAGQDCHYIQPVPCDQNLQNATSTPASQFHSDPPQALDACASACCPMGYDCKDNNCVAKTAPSSTASSTTSAGVTPLGTPSGNLSSDAPSSSNTSSSFSGPSFAAGFVPGIVLGAVVAGFLLAWLFRRRKDRRTKSEQFSEKPSKSGEDLTDLSPLSANASHVRNISDPIGSPSRSHRTDFLRGSPVRPGPGPSTPDRAPASQPSFSHSPFMDPPSSTQPSIPDHLKRGTLSFTIAPLRALKKQKSTRSLRRKATNASNSSSQRLRRSSERSRTDSTETIQVHMGDGPYTPDQRNLAAQPQPSDSSTQTSRHPNHISVPSSSSSWETRDSDMPSPQITNSDPPPPIPAPYAMRYPYTTPPSSSLRPNGPGETPVLGTPYTPSRVATKAPERSDGDGGLMVPDDARKRDTTFSGIMRTAGLSQSDLVPMPKKR